LGIKEFEPQTVNAGYFTPVRAATFFQRSVATLINLYIYIYNLYF